MTDGKKLSESGGQTAKKPKRNVHAGHRARMWAKLKHMRFEDLPEHEQLEMLLFTILPRVNTNELAHELLHRFGSIYEVTIADKEELMKVDGVGEKVANFLTILAPLSGAIERSKKGYFKKNSACFKSSGVVVEYAKTYFYDNKREKLICFFLDEGRYIIKRKVVSEGDVSRTDLGESVILNEAIDSNVKYVVMVHNHPSCNVDPSEHDIYMTKIISSNLEAIGCILLDHIIIGGDDWLSMKSSGYI